jgi:putative peptidoglycan lipid II flippase
MRDVAYSQSFGAGTLMDAFLVAYKIPSFLRRLFADGAFSQSFVPVVSEYRVARRPDDVRDLVSGIAGTLGAAVFVVTLIGVIVAPFIVMVFAPGFTQQPDKYALAVEMLRWTLPFLFFISLASLFSGVLNSYGRFVVPAVAQVLMNVVMIGFAIGIAAQSSSPGPVLAIGVFVAGAVALLWQLPFVARLGLLSRPRWQPAQEGVRKVRALMLPGILGSSMAQVSLLLDTLIASFLVTGSIAWLYFADRLMEFALGVFSIALATVILPGLSAQHASGSREAFAATLDWALRLVFLIATPAAVALFVLAGPLTATIFGYGQFDARDVEMTRLALMAYSWGLLMFSLVKVLAPGYFARQDTRTPVRFALIALAVNVGINVLVVLPAHVLGFPTPFVLLATSTCVAAGINAWLLWRGLARQGVYLAQPGWTALLLRIGAASAVMATVVVAFGLDLADWLAAPPTQRAGRLALCVVSGLAAYFGALFVCGARLKHLRPAAVMR